MLALTVRWCASARTRWGGGEGRLSWGVNWLCAALLLVSTWAGLKTSSSKRWGVE